MPQREEPDVAEPQTVDLPSELRGLTAEVLLVPGQCRRGVGGAEMDGMEPDPVAVLDQLDPGAPRVEDEPMLVEPGLILQRGSVREPLQPDAGPADPHRLDLAHLRGEIRVGERETIDAGPLAAPERWLRIKGDLHALAVDRVVTVRQGLAVEVTRIPAHRLGGVRRGDMHVVVVGSVSRKGREKQRAGYQRKTRTSKHHLDFLSGSAY